MAEKEQSIEAMKQSVSFACDVAEAADRIYEDEKIEKEEVFAEGMNLAMKAGKLLRVGEAFKQRSLLNDDVKRQELVAFIEQDLDLINDGAEQIAEDAVNVLNAIWKLKGSIQKYKKPKVV